MSLRNGRWTAPISLGLVAGIACVVLSPSAQATPETSNPQPTKSTAAAKQALDTVQAALDPAPSDARVRTSVPAGPSGTGDLTLAMRELRTSQDQLSAADQATAAKLLSRPSGTQTRDFGNVRVHWSLGDGVTSAYVDEVGGVVQHVLATYEAAGYRAPESDGTRGGGDGMLDIYLQDLGSQGLYGYCDSDGPPPADGPYDTWAYCAFDNNYTEFPAHTPKQNLEVTAAHELFHAVQFAYDYDEDSWFMEATATWAEDEVYDDVNDNRQYLADSPLSHPAHSMDFFDQQGVQQYGDWIFFRYLTERFPSAVGKLPVIIRKIWERADGATGGPDDYSIQAVAHVLADKGLKLRRVFAQFADANRRPDRTYSEGKHYPSAPVGKKWSLSQKHRDTGWSKVRLDHLASSTVRFTPDQQLRKHWRLKVDLDLPRRSQGSAAVITVYPKHGKPQTQVIDLDKAGDATKSIVFGSRSVARVELTLVNAGTDYKCWHGTNYSCQGRSLDDDRAMKYRARAVSQGAASRASA